MLALLSLDGGCIVVHQKPLPPGHIDVRAPPAYLTESTGRPFGAGRRYVEAPHDAGEDITWLNFGVLSGMGEGIHAGQFVPVVGPEVSLHVGHSAEDHQNDEWWVIPERAWGVNVGWAPDVRSGRGPAYLELQWTNRPFWAAGGWAWNPRSNATGPQLSAGLGPVFLRANVLSREEGTLIIGLAIKGGVSWVEGR